MSAANSTLAERYGIPLAGIDGVSLHGYLYLRGVPLIGGNASTLPPTWVLKLGVALHPKLRRCRRAADRALQERPWRAVANDWEQRVRPAWVGRQRGAPAGRAVDLHRRRAGGAPARVRRRLAGRLLDPLRLPRLGPAADLGLRRPGRVARPRPRRAAGRAHRLVAGVRGRGRGVGDGARRGPGGAHRLGLVPGDPRRAPGDRPDRHRGARRVPRAARLADGHVVRPRGSGPRRAPSGDPRAHPDRRIDGRQRRGAAPRASASPTASGPRSRSRLATTSTGSSTTPGSPTACATTTAPSWGRGRWASCVGPTSRPGDASRPSGRLDHPDHVFELLADEVAALLGDAAASAGPARDDVARRARDRRSAADADAPLILGSPFVAPDASGAAGVDGAAHPGPGADRRGQRLRRGRRRIVNRAAAVVGTGIGDRSVEGIARVAIDAGVALAEIEPDEILVARSTNPAWNAVLPLVGALVVEEGGALSHAGIMARGSTSRPSSAPPARRPRSARATSCASTRWAAPSRSCGERAERHRPVDGAKRPGRAPVRWQTPPMGMPTTLQVGDITAHAGRVLRHRAGSRGREPLRRRGGGAPGGGAGLGDRRGSGQHRPGDVGHRDRWHHDRGRPVRRVGRVPALRARRHHPPGRDARGARRAPGSRPTTSTCSSSPTSTASASPAWSTKAAPGRRRSPRAASS